MMALMLLMSARLHKTKKKGGDASTFEILNYGK